MQIKNDQVSRLYAGGSCSSRAHQKCLTQCRRQGTLAATRTTQQQQQLGMMALIEASAATATPMDVEEEEEAHSSSSYLISDDPQPQPQPPQLELQQTVLDLHPPPELEPETEPETEPDPGLLKDLRRCMASHRHAALHQALPYADSRALPMRAT